MAYLKSKKTQKILSLTLILILIVFFVFYNKDSQKEFPIGIWQGTYEERPISFEFKENGRFILISGGEDAIGFGSYSIDLEKQPGRLDLEFIIEQGWEPLITIIEKVDADTFRIQFKERVAIRPVAFTSEAFFLKRAKDHVFTRMKTIEQRDEELKELEIKEGIWFDGKNHKELLDICETLFRHQFNNNASAQQQNAPAYHLSIFDIDPPEDLMACFQHNNIPVKPGSEFQEGSGLKFRISSIKLINNKNVEIEGGYYEGNVSSSGNSYILKKKGQVWEVISDKMNWIS